MGGPMSPQTPGSAQEHVKQLPSIWTTQGFRTFADLRSETCRVAGSSRNGSVGAEVSPQLQRPSTSDVVTARPSTSGSTATCKSARSHKPRRAPPTVLPLPAHAEQKYKEYKTYK